MALGFIRDELEAFPEIAATTLLRKVKAKYPQSKGKVERFIVYVKSDFLYGFYYQSVAALNEAGLVWLSDVANARIHGTTGRVPAEMFAQERLALKPFEDLENALATRLADKTGLLSFEGNKYSVPYEYQRSRVKVKLQGEELFIYEPSGGKEIARHVLSKERGKIIKNNNHYRDYRAPLSQLSDQTKVLFQGCGYADELIGRIKNDNPTIVRDQLRGLMHLHKRYDKSLWEAAITTILNLPLLRVTIIKSILSSYQARQKVAVIEKNLPETDPGEHSVLDRSLEKYMEVIDHAG